MPNYQLGKIYKIVDNTNESIYIGSTCEPILSRRLAGHVANYKTYCGSENKKTFVTSYDIIKNDNYYIELIELYPCNSKDELLKRERYYIQTLDCVNKTIPGRTKKEWNADNMDKIIKYKKQYNNDNKEKIKKYYKEYDEKRSTYRNTRLKCLCGSTYLRRSYYLHVKTDLHKQFGFDNHNQIMINIDVLLFKTNAFIKESELFISKYLV